MVRLALLVLLLASGPALFPSALTGFRGTLLNGIDPYLIRSDHGALYRCQWIGGSVRWFEGDRVYLTRAWGPADMIKLGEDTVTRVEVEEICPGSLTGRAHAPGAGGPSRRGAGDRPTGRRSLESGMPCSGGW